MEFKFLIYYDVEKILNILYQRITYVTWECVLHVQLAESTLNLYYLEVN